jgi:hypothetical protein
MLYRQTTAVCSQIHTKHKIRTAVLDVTPVAHQYISAYSFFLRSAPAIWLLLLLLLLVFAPHSTCPAS